MKIWLKNNEAVFTELQSHDEDWKLALEIGM
jgi:hypothetical protein